MVVKWENIEVRALKLIDFMLLLNWIEKGVACVRNKVQSAMDRRLNMWEKYCLRHCFVVPDGFSMSEAVSFLVLLVLFISFWNYLSKSFFKICVLWEFRFCQGCKSVKWELENLCEFVYLFSATLPHLCLTNYIFCTRNK